MPHGRQSIEGRSVGVKISLHQSPPPPAPHPSAMLDVCETPDIESSRKNQTVSYKKKKFNKKKKLIKTYPRILSRRRRPRGWFQQRREHVVKPTSRT